MDENIYTGIWTNWSRGTVLGLTLTTTKQYGNLLIAFTALFVAFVGSRLWKISCLVLHRCYSTAEDRGVIHHQRQVILRNSRSAESALFEILSLFWTWRKSRIRRISGLIPLIILSAIYVAAFTAAGGFSSNISSSIGDEVLINGQNCGTIVTNDTVQGLSIEKEWSSEQSNSAANYVQQCYRTDQSNTTTACNKFVRSSLPTHTINTTAECPFQHQICRKPQSTLRLDSGYIDSNDDLGLNAPKNERFALRYVLHCAPLETANYTSHVEEDGRGWDKYHYGTRVVGPSDNRTGLMDYIFKVPDLNSQYIFQAGVSLADHNLKLNYDRIFMVQGESAGWNPIPELVRQDGDLTIAMLSGAGVQFLRLMDDDWYRAITPWINTYGTRKSGLQPTWHPDVSASPMGCLEQFQWCNSAYPRDRGCGPLTSYQDAFDGAAPLFNATKDILDADRPLSSDAIPARFISARRVLDGYPTSLPDVVGTLGPRSLASQSKFFGGSQSPLPENQWQLDVLQWWNIVLTTIQASCELNVPAFVGTAQGITDPNFLQYRSPPLNDQEQNICNSQKIRSSSYTSFSCFGLYFTFILGALITVTSYVLEPILNCLHRRRQHKSYAHLEWISNTSLQLHRMAHEQLMGHEWAKCTDDIPTTDPEISLASLDISDPSHPILRRPEAPEEKTEAVESSTFPGDFSDSPHRESLHLENEAQISGRTSNSSNTSVSDGSWTLHVHSAIMNVSGQFSAEDGEHAVARRDTMDSHRSGLQVETNE